jgi:hypothetical protein
VGLDYYRSLRILALAEVVRDDASSQYSLRRVMRWYSKAFHTPLHVVEELPLHDVLMHYYESHYEELNEAEGARIALHDELIELSMTDEERRAKALKDAQLEYEDYLFTAAVSETERKKAKAEFQSEGKTSKLETGTKTSPDIMSESPPDIKMTFMSESQLEEMIAADGLGGFDDLVGLK